MDDNHLRHETLAERAISFLLAPMTWGEWTERELYPVVENLLLHKLSAELTVAETDVPNGFLLRGFMLALLTLSDRQDILDWWSGHVSTYLESDLRALSQIFPELAAEERQYVPESITASF